MNKVEEGVAQLYSLVEMMLWLMVTVHQPSDDKGTASVQVFDCPHSSEMIAALLRIRLVE